MSNYELHLKQYKSKVQCAATTCNRKQHKACLPRLLKNAASADGILARQLLCNLGVVEAFSGSEAGDRFLGGTLGRGTAVRCVG